MKSFLQLPARMLRAFRLTILGVFALGFCDECRRVYRHLGYSNDYCARCEDELFIGVRSTV
jgi:hypothetical protein